MIPFYHNSNLCHKKGNLTCHKMKDKFFTKDELFLFLYVDDGALPFLSRLDALLGSEITLREMSRLGLNIHLGKGEKSSKTEAVFSPSRTKMQSWIDEHDKNLISDINLPIDNTKKKYKTPLKNMKVITDRSYRKAEETRQLILNDLSFISFTRNFKYLGSWI